MSHWWCDLLRWWAEVGAWWQTIDWGTAPDWFAAVGTVGAFALGFVILLLDRSRRRRAAAEAFVAWSEIETGGSSAGGLYTEVRVGVYNAGQSPIIAVYVTVKWSDGQQDDLRFGKNWRFNIGDFIRSRVLPGKTVPFGIVAVGTMRDVDAILVEFTDSAGKRWVRDTTKRSLKKYRR